MSTFLQSRALFDDSSERLRLSRLIQTFPKAGGLAFALNAMGGKLHQLIDVTIVYPDGIPSFFAYLSGKVPEVRVHLRSMPIEKELLGDYLDDPIYRAYFQSWVNRLWQEKDHCFERMLTGK